MRASLRLKVALAFSVVTIGLLVAQALGVRAIAERQEEALIDSLVADDMRDLLQSYRMNPSLIPPLDGRLNARVSQDGGTPVRVPARLKDLSSGMHEVVLDGREIHIAVTALDGVPVYRVYDFNRYEKHFKNAINALMIATGVFALLTIWLAYGLSGLLVRQIKELADKVKALQSGTATPISPGKYDEVEVEELAAVFNDYQRRMGDMIARETAFAGNVSHELRTPLTAIKTSCELLLAGELSARDRVRVAQIDAAADRMHALIDALLKLARSESPDAAAPVPLRAAIANQARAFGQELASASTTLHNEVDAGVRVHLNRAAFDIVLSNLLSNAIRHTRGGEIRVDFRDGTLHVDDTGSGIPAEALPRLFDRFYRAGQAPDGIHFGIGLSIVKKLCDEQGWTIRIASTAGQGTQLALTFSGIDRQPG